MHVSLTAEPLFHIGPLTVTNSLMTTWLVVFGITIFAVIFRLRLREHPRGMQNVVEVVIEAFHGLVESVTDDAKQARQFFATIFTIFLFVLLNNWAGLIPGVGSIGIARTEHAEVEVFGNVSALIHTEDLPAAEHAPEQVPVHADYAVDGHADTDSHVEEAAEQHVQLTPIFRPGTADLSFTLGLAVVAVILVQAMGVRGLGGWNYFRKFINLKNPVLFFVGLLEIISEFSKMISFSFRLFGNIFAGEVLLTVIIALAPFIVPIPFYGLEIFVGAIQALVFSVLTLVFFKMAVTAH
ncbi:MAG: F0F1 ATP synthase subunit A [Patescibacteria group bacterium]